MRAGFAAVGGMMIACLLVVSMLPVNAGARTSGEFWTYSMFTQVASTNVSGTVTYQFKERTDLMLGGTRYGVDVMRFNGELSGSTNILTVPFLVNATVSGTAFNYNQGMTLAKDDSFLFANTTLGSGSFKLAGHIQTEVITTYTPPYLIMFNPSKSKPGDFWAEHLIVNTTTIQYQNGTIQSRENDTRDITINADIASAEEQVTTEAGTFKTLKVTVSRGDGNFTIFWWSSKVGNIVKQRDYSAGSPAPSSGLTLKDFESQTAETLVVVIIGAIVVAVAIVIIVAILTTRSRPGLPGAYHPGSPLWKGSAVAPGPPRQPRPP